jgi:hypothetical protein
MLCHVRELAQIAGKVTTERAPPKQLKFVGSTRTRASPGVEQGGTWGQWRDMLCHVRELAQIAGKVTTERAPPKRLKFVGSKAQTRSISLDM